MNWFIVVVTACAGLTTVATFVKWVLPLLRQWGHFFDDWNGEPARPGQDARPGVLERLAAVEHQVKNSHETNLRDDIDELHATARETATSARNTAASLADHVADSRAAMRAGQADKDAIAKVLGEHSAAIANLAEALPIVARSTPHESDEEGG